MHSLETIKRLNGDGNEVIGDPSKPFTLAEPYDVAAAIIAYESGVQDVDDTLVLFQHLVDTGKAWELQGSYGRQAMRFINAGLIEARENPMK